MKRAAVVLALLVALAAAPAADAGVLSQRTAQLYANAYAQRAAAVSGWATRWGALCGRMTPWRFWCQVSLTSWRPRSPTCTLMFNVVEAAFSAAVRYDDFDTWDCYYSR